MVVGTIVIARRNDSDDAATQIEQIIQNSWIASL